MPNITTTAHGNGNGSNHNHQTQNTPFKKRRLAFASSRHVHNIIANRRWLMLEHQSHKGALGTIQRADERSGKEQTND
jgi:hypothetical protein